MIVAGRLIVERYFERHSGHAGVRAARRQFDAWLAEASGEEWRNPAEVKRKYASASIVAGNRAVFNISGNRYRLIVKMNYSFGIIEIRFFGTHAEYDRIDAETI